MVTLVIATHLFYIQYNNQNHNINIKNNEDLCSPARRVVNEKPRLRNQKMTTQPSLQVLGLVHTFILVFTQHQRILLARQAQQNNVTQAS